eukprot:CAMPEP_0119414934 /NCGR_PEP_ID=MMETSP1335-20130426/7251_1 /TAXON_ID=259385 /ORGANISM="Chrysoculter rhomboideus, Strain RCC1486" /LENGTH=328 /DNA_ID=CAMNT_0007439831 /DNA_START=19 /DNA_END=1005 /DNA_ORIENTATION=-
MAEAQASKKAKIDPGIEPEKLVKQCMSVLQALMANDLAEPFNVKVDWKKLGLHDYPKVIKHPMDLGTVKEKLKLSKYSTTADFAQDVRLVWKNAKTYNQEGSEIYNAASELETEFEQKFSSVPRGALRASDALAKAKDIVKAIRKLPNADAFNEPVDWEGLKLDDYLDVIKEPMDLGTILRRLEAGNHYSSVEGVFQDLDLVWRNAMSYNMEGSPVHEAARKLKVLAEKKFADLLRESGDLGMLDAAKPKDVSFEMKQELVSNANELSSKELYGMVYIVTQNCPTAMDSSQEEEVEMDVDNLDPDTFMLVDRYVKDCLAKRKVKGKQK